MAQHTKEIIEHWLSRQETGTRFTAKDLHFDLFHNISRGPVNTALKKLQEGGHVELTKMRMGQSPVWVVLKGKKK